MSKDVKESDWITFREHLSTWRERYLDKKTETFVELLQDDDRPPTERFWALKEQVDEEATILQDCLDGFSRSNMHVHLMLMYRHGLIDDADLDRFSEQLQSRIRSWFEQDYE